MKIFTVLKKLWSALTSSSGPLVDAHANVANSNVSQGKNSPFVNVTANISANEDSLRTKINELQTEIEKVKSESEDKYALLQQKYDQMRAIEPVPGKSYFLHKATSRMICPKCYSELDGALHFLTKATYNNTMGMECQVCDKFYPDNHNA